MHSYSMHLTRCVYLFPLLFFKFLVFEAAMYSNKDVYIERTPNCPKTVSLAAMLCSSTPKD